MPYALVPLVDNPDWRPGMLRFHRQRWVGWDAELGWNGVRLRRDLALVWHPTVTLTDPQARVLADDGLDVLNPTRRGLLAALAPDRRLTAGMRLRDMVGDFLMRQTPGGMPPLTPHRDGRYEILCGPGPQGANRLWEQATEPDGPHSQDIQDEFGRPDGNVAGSTTSDGQTTWELVGGTGSTIQVVSNQCQSQRAGSDVSNNLLLARNMDTANHYAQADLVSATSGGGSWNWAHGVLARIRYGDYSGGDEGYSAYCYKQSDGYAERDVADNVTGTPLPGATDTTSTTSGTFSLSLNGSTYLFSIDGSTVFTGTDTLYATYKRVGFFHYVSGGSNPNVVSDNYRAADLSAVVPRRWWANAAATAWQAPLSHLRRSVHRAR